MINDDGSSGFATATVPEVVTESTYGFAGRQRRRRQCAVAVAHRREPVDAVRVGVAVIGGWRCSVDGRSFAMTVTGSDQESVSTSIFELVNAFDCEA